MRWEGVWKGRKGLSRVLRSWRGLRELLHDLRVWVPSSAGSWWAELLLVPGGVLLEVLLSCCWIQCLAEERSSRRESPSVPSPSQVEYIPKKIINSKSLRRPQQQLPSPLRRTDLSVQLLNVEMASKDSSPAASTSSTNSVVEEIKVPPPPR